MKMMYFEELIFELEWEAKRIHAKSVMYKCMKLGHIKWAMKIASKYSIQLPQHDDTVMAFAMALKASNSINPQT